ncbi:MAG: glycoside hydrolase family 15 protein, partial [Thermoleophilia bacterium]
YWAERAPPANSDEAFERMERTAEFWRGWINQGVFPEHPWQSFLQRAALTLKGLTYAPTGALLAAATTSLPETPGGERNYDYRYTWIRDATFMLWGLYTLGFEREANDFFYFVADVCDEDPELQIMYGVGGERELPEEELDHLGGYEDARPVRIGNAAAHQHQHDVYGELLDLTWAWHRQGRSPDADDWRFLVELVNEAAKRWTTPDRGIWELRGRPRHLVHSKVMCWVALDRGLRLADELGFPAPIGRWTSTRTAIRAEVERHGYDPGRGVFTQAFDRPELDAALLLLPSTGFVAWDDPRMLRTVDAVRSELEVGGLLLRYRASDGLQGAEGAFVACTFWLAECLARQGRTGPAQAAFARASATANDLGLFAEEFDPGTETLLGN